MTYTKIDTASLRQVGRALISRTQRDYVLGDADGTLGGSIRASAGLSKGLACGQADGPVKAARGGLTTGAKHPLGNPSAQRAIGAVARCWPHAFSKLMGDCCPMPLWRRRGFY